VIEECAFSFAKLTSVTFPETVTIIEDGAFIIDESNFYFDGDAPERMSSEFSAYHGRIHYYPGAKGFERFEDQYRLLERTDGSYKDVNVEYAVNEEFSLLFNSKSGVIYGCEGSIGVLEIPSEIGGVKVAQIGERAFEKANIGKVFIPDTVTFMGDYAFSECHNLHYVTIGEGIKSIAAAAFYKCTQLETVILGSNVEVIEREAFQSDAMLHEVILPEGLKKIGDKAFRECKSLKLQKLPKCLEYIGYAAFYGTWGEWGDLILPENLRVIKESAFQSTGFKYVLLPESIEWIEHDAFRGNGPLYVGYMGDGNGIGWEVFRQDVTIFHQKDAPGFEHQNLESYSKVAVEQMLMTVTICDNLTGIIGSSYLYVGQCFEYDFNTIPVVSEEYIHDVFVNGERCTESSVEIEPIVEDVLVSIYYIKPPQLNCYTKDAIILVKEEFAEYSLDGVNWQSSNVFENLSGQHIKVYQRYSIGGVTTIQSNALSVNLKVTDFRIPVLGARTDEMLVLRAISGYEYSMDRENWQNSPCFSGLQPGTEYQLYQRIQGEYYVGRALQVKTLEGKVVIEAVYEDLLWSYADELPEGFTFEADATTDVGAVGEKEFSIVYSKDAELFEENLEWAVKVVVSPGIPKYTIPGEVEAHAGEALSRLEKRLPAGFCFEEEQNVPEYPGEYVYTVSFTPEDTVNYKSITGIPVKVIVLSVPAVETYTDTAVLLKSVEGYEYSCDMLNWQESPLFMELQPGMKYTFYQKRTSGERISEDVSVVTLTEKPLIEATYKDKLWDYENKLPWGYHFEESKTAEVGTVGEREFTILYTAQGDDNAEAEVLLKWAVKVIVSKAIPEYTVPKAVEALSGEGTIALEQYLPEGFGFEKNELVPEVAGEYTYTIMYIPADTANYEIVTGINMTVIVLNSPEIVTYTDSTVLLEECEGYEYSMDGVNWQTSPLFTDLQAETEYSFCQRRIGGSRISETEKVITQQEKTEESTEITFADVPMDSWKYESALYVYKRGIMEGTGLDDNGNVIFEPDKQLTREQFTQVLYNLEGEEEVTYNERFADVEDGKWYTSSVLWAAEKGIVSGYDEDTFGVGDEITREQMASMLYEYAKYKGYSTEAAASFEQFEDAEQISSWAVIQLQWAVGNGVMSGKGTILDPRGSALRAECAAMLNNFMTAFEIP